MKILVTGSNGFVGKNLCRRLKMIQNGNDRTHPEIEIEEVFEYDKNTPQEHLTKFCKKADFVFHLAGVNRPKDTKEFMEGNKNLTQKLIETMKSVSNKCPTMYASSIQASLTGRYNNSEYGKSKLAGEELLFEYSKKTGAKVLIYRFPNLFGKWCRPNYNSVIATFCYNTAHDLPIQVNDRNTTLELLYIDDLVDGMILALSGKEKHCRYEGVQAINDQEGVYCYIPITYHVTLGQIEDELKKFAEQPQTLIIPEQPQNSFTKKLYATYLSYLPENKISFPLKTSYDNRGSFTELFRSLQCGQVSVNISKPGITKGQHWHNTKWEFFIVISGHGLIQEREIGTDKVLEYEVSGEKIEAVHMLPGYTHNIINLSNTEDLITIMWANELFDPSNPDTFSEEV